MEDSVAETDHRVKCRTTHQIQQVRNAADSELNCQILLSGSLLSNQDHVSAEVNTGHPKSESCEFQRIAANPTCRIYDATHVVSLQNG